MLCPKCGDDTSKVLQTVKSIVGIQRKRECCCCDYVWPTIEAIDPKHFEQVEEVLENKKYIDGRTK